VSLPEDSHLDPELVALLALGERPGTPEEDVATYRHLGECGACRTEVDQLAAVARTARRIDPLHELVPAPESVWAGITAELATTPVPVTSLAERRRRRTSWVMVAAAACVGAIVGGSGVYAATGRTTPEPAQPSPAVLATASLEPLKGSAAHGSVEVVSSASGPRVLVDVSGLAAPQGYYEVWLLDRKAQKLVSLGALDGADHGSFAMPPGVSMSDYPVVDISLEPGDGNPEHSHNSLVRGTLPA